MMAIDRQSTYPIDAFAVELVRLMHLRDNLAHDIRRIHRRQQYLAQDLARADSRDPCWFNRFIVLITRRKLMSAFDDLNSNLAAVTTAAQDITAAVQMALPALTNAKGAAEQVQAANDAAAAVAASLGTLAQTMAADAKILTDAVTPGA